MLCLSPSPAVAVELRHMKFVGAGRRLLADDSLYFICQPGELKRCGNTGNGP